jgi:hypothetical protein
MDEYLARLFGSQPSYMGQLMGADDAERLRQEAQRQGLLGTGIGLLMASGPSQQRQNIGQIVGQGLMAGQQAYRGAMQQAVQDRMTGLQLAEMVRKQQAMETARKELPKLVQTTETPGAQIPLPVPMDEEGNVMPEARMPGQITRAINHQSAAALRQVLDPKQYADLIKAAETEVGINAPQYKIIGNQVVAIAPNQEPRVVFSGERNLTFQSVDGKVVGLDPTTGQKVVEHKVGGKTGLNEIGRVYAAVRFPGVVEANLSGEQLAEAFNYSQMPNAIDAANAAQNNLRLQAETGLTGPAPQARPALVAPARQAPQAAPQAAPQVAPQVAPPQATGQAQPAPQPVAQPAPTQAAPQQALQAPVSGEPAYTQSTVENPTVVNPAIPLKTRNEFKSKQPQAMSATVSMLRTYRDTQNDIRNLINNDAGLRAASGFGGELVSAVPGTQAANAKAILDKLKNRSFVANINEMRAASPTGAAVGAVTEREGARFENLIASLSQAQTYDQLKRQLVELDNFLLETSSATKNAYEQDFGRNQTINSVFSQMPKALTQQQVTPGDLGSAARQELERRKQRK